ncbi:UvrD-helicase domain-containing protein [Enterobacteriaceae bacterium ET-AT1-13]|nr:UvrD-helicase domain-containing protein [Enterobacteriaceae bacterium ET-AT1-13]WGS66375.1 UvrD-helicase domain-containing protein [Enterobacteriaceae bacterium Cmel17]WMC17401.1 MAG: 3'-5' exonuclease [Enterobacteriaceae bacterium Cmel21]WMC17812.1 MAG: UvrD-helicase domain-containing protein [Enterobacteriaceae bacterium PSmelAO3-1]WMC18015.1 MAG: UvrD-helicase domain-containing protein [Enterobacteriaceae bacterium PSmelAO1]
MYSKIIKNMNENQIEAITSNNKNLLILAGAGSGKTRVLVNRIFWLIKNQNISPKSILAVTFTNKSSKEIYNRINKLIKFNINDIWVGTFHGLAYKMLYLNSNNKNFQIIDKNDQIYLIKSITKKLNLDIKKYPPIKSMYYINKIKNLGLYSKDYVDMNCSNEFNNKLLYIYKIYQKECYKHCFLDFGEILISANDFLFKNPVVLKKYNMQFKYILIDEFQDINNIQYKWISTIKNKNNKIMVVGDDDQSIYGWRGAKSEFIQKFIFDYPDTKIIRLEQNYRSTGNILFAANELINNNNNRIKKKLWTQKKNGELISIYSAKNEIDEAVFIVNYIKIWKYNGGLLNDFAVLYRKNIQSNILEKILLRNNINYEILNSINFFNRIEIKLIIFYLRFILNNNDNISFLKIINTPKRGIGINTINKINEISKKYKISLFKAVYKILKYKILKNRQFLNLNGFFILINEIKKKIINLKLYEQINYIIQKIDLFLMYKKKEDFKIRINNVYELIELSKKFYFENIKETEILKLFLSNIILNNDNIDIKKIDSVKLMTLHSSKGLEFNQVFIIGMEEGIFPNKFIINSKSLEEERRLAYVGITRAKKKLILTYTKSRYLHGKNIFPIPSRFIKEIPKKFIKKIENYKIIL